MPLMLTDFLKYITDITFSQSWKRSWQDHKGSSRSGTEVYLILTDNDSLYLPECWALIQHCSEQGEKNMGKLLRVTRQWIGGVVYHWDCHHDWSICIPRTHTYTFIRSVCHSCTKKKMLFHQCDLQEMTYNDKNNCHTTPNEIILSSKM